MRKSAAHHRPSIREKLILPALFLAVLVGLVLFGVFPTSQKIKKTKTQIESLNTDLKRQNTLLPVHASLLQHKKKSLPEAISVNTIKPLKIEDLTDLPEVFETLARDSNVELVNVTPQVRSLKGDREVLQVNTRIRGNFATFTDLLNQLNKMDFVDTIESLIIDVTKLGPEMSLSVWLAIQ